MHNDATMRQRPPPIATVTSTTTTIYDPPSDGFPFVAAIFSPDGTIQAFRAFPMRRDAEAFLQAFMQEGAGEYGLNEHGQRGSTWMGGGS
jgi:hypothetical protein